MLAAIVRRLDRYWQGPALRLVIGDESYCLGRGQPRTEITVRNRRVLGRLLVSPSLAFGEGYMRGDLDVRGSLADVVEGYARTEQVLRRHLRAARWLARLRTLQGRVRPARAVRNARHHYDIGNEFFARWLDPSLSYSCAYFRNDGDTLAEAQRQKLELVCRKSQLRPGQSLLDIGCGWGGLLFHAAENHGVLATGITPAREQARHIETEAARRGLRDRVRVICGDWRELSGRYDRIVSIGMFEHVGQRQYAEFFRRWQRLLAPGGISLLHTIGRMDRQGTDSWFTRYIFPGSWLPALFEVAQQAARAGLMVADVENLWQHYVKTAHAWDASFRAERADFVARHGEPFVRMWELYLQAMEGGFRAGALQLWQVVLLEGKEAPWPLDREVRLEARSVREPQDRRGVVLEDLLDVGRRAP
jgi:cyclopropane-fatty-acyl-phospholipid synthase